jgi:hypothetical protein
MKPIAGGSGESPALQNPRAIRDSVNTAIQDPTEAKNVATYAQQMLREGKEDASVVAYLTRKGVDEGVAKQAVADAKLPPSPKAERPKSPGRQAAADRARAKGSAFEPIAKQTLEGRGETVINSQRPRGPHINEGFDSLSYTGTGKDAKLFINDAKNVVGEVTVEDFRSFGLSGKTGKGYHPPPDTLARSKRIAQEAIESQVKDRATREALLDQLNGVGGAKATVRIIAPKGTPPISEATAQTVAEKTKWNVQREIIGVPNE